MTVNPVPALHVGPNDPPPAVFRRISDWSKRVSPVMYQAFSAVTGTLPVPSAPSNSYLLMAGAPSPTFTAGAGSFTFPQPFPNGVLTANATALVAYAAGAAVVQVTSLSTTAIGLVLTIGGSGYTGSSYAILLQVIGW